MFSFDADKLEIHMYDQIGPEWAGMIGSEQLSGALDAMGGRDVTIYLSTPGGSVDVGTDMFNMLDRYKGKVTIVVDAIAASMGSYILQAADERIVNENSKLMIHNPWSIAFGDANTFRKEADVLDKYRDGMLPGYSNRTLRSVNEISALMDAETWYVGQEIVDAGFADKVAGQAKSVLDMKKVAFWSHKGIPEAIERHEKERTAAMMRRSMSLAEAKAIRDRIQVERSDMLC